MNVINIRTAKLEDLEVLLEFEQGVITAERAFDPTLKEGIINYYDIKKMIIEPHINLVVAIIDSTIVGSGYARIEKAKPYLKHVSYGYLGFMYTAPLHRGKGVNAKIIEALKEWCLSQKILELRLDVYDENPSAIKAYEKVGFRKHLANMRVQL